jgi:TM2 domain-containing membrane protein YozV
LLTFFLGGFGVHKFYLAKNIQGIFYFLFSWTLIPLLFSMVEFLIYLFTGEEKLNGKYRAGATPLVIIMAVCGPFVFIIALGTVMAIAFPVFLLSDTGQKVLAPIMEKAFSQSLDFEASGDDSGTMPAFSSETAMKQAGSAEETAALKAGGTCSGKIHGQHFSVDNVYIQNGILHLGQGTGFFADQEMVIFMFLEDNDVSSQRIHVSADDDGFNHPHIHLKWQSGDEPGPQTEVAMKGYDLDIEFGQAVGKTVQGKIDLNIPGDKETCLAGTFTAEIADE